MARRRTRYAPFRRCAQTTATSQFDEARSSRAGHEPWPCRPRRPCRSGRSQGTSGPPGPLVSLLTSSAPHRRAANCPNVASHHCRWCATYRPPAVAARSCGYEYAARHLRLQGRGWRCRLRRLCGAEERSVRGPRAPAALRELTRRSRLSAASAGRAASSATGPRTRAPQGTPRSGAPHSKPQPAAHPAAPPLKLARRRKTNGCYAPTSDGRLGGGVSAGCRFLHVAADQAEQLFFGVGLAQVVVRRRVRPRSRGASPRCAR